MNAPGALRLPKEGEVRPYYQPIVSLQTQKIMGYESLGRLIADDRAVSLGPYFQDASIGEENHLHTDRLLRRLALERLARDDSQAKLFINLKPSWIYKQYKRDGFLPTLQMIRRHKLDPGRVVVEITEEEFKGGLDELSEAIDVYREAGCMIALDDIGAGYSNYDRIASIKPNILKIDLKLLKKSSVHTGYQALLNSFSILAGQMGASLLVEGVETKGDLYQALKVGARYVQGYLFSAANADFMEAMAFRDMLRGEMKEYTLLEQQRYRSLFAVQDSLNELVLLGGAVGSFTDADSVIERLLHSALDSVTRIYICREDGAQVSANYTRSDNGEWRKDEQYRGANWIWRPYFIPNIVRMNHQKHSMLSAVYTDLDTAKLMQTYSCPLGDQHYLFLDLQV